MCSLIHTRYSSTRFSRLSYVDDEPKNNKNSNSDRSPSTSSSDRNDRNNRSTSSSVYDQRGRASKPRDEGKCLFLLYYSYADLFVQQALITLERISQLLNQLAVINISVQTNKILILRRETTKCLSLLVQLPSQVPPISIAMKVFQYQVNRFFSLYRAIPEPLENHFSGLFYRGTKRTSIRQIRSALSALSMGLIPSGRHRLSRQRCWWETKH